MKEIVKDCSNCEGSKYCISKPNKNDYKFPEEENQYLIDLECGIWYCHTGVIKLLKENAELKDNVERLKPLVCEHKADITSCYDDITRLTNENEQLKAQIEKMKCCGNCKHCEFKIISDGSTRAICTQLKGDVCLSNNYDNWELAE